MALYTVLHFPDPRLRNKALPVKQVDHAVQTLIADMFETMYENNGIGLAATQINIPQRIVVIDVSDSRDQRTYLINPEILEKSGTEEMEEGCLSVPGIYDKVQRAEKIKVRSLNLEGQSFEFEADGLLAVCIQHEVEHLDGKLFIDHLSTFKRQRAEKKFKKQRQHNL